MKQPWQHKVFEPRLLAAWSQVGKSSGETEEFPPIDRMFHHELQTLQGVAFHFLSSDPLLLQGGKGEPRSCCLATMESADHSYGSYGFCV